MSLAKQIHDARKRTLRLRKILSKSSLTIAKALIKYKYNPCLWNVHHMFYRHSAVKSSAWDEVVKIWREFEPYANEIYVKVKVAQMRSRSIIQRQMYEESKARNIAYKPTAWYYHHFDFIPTPKKMPRYNDHLGFVVIPIAAPNQPDANEASSKPRAVNNIGEQPELKQLPQYETAQITTTNGLVETDTTAQLDLEASTNEPDLMASPNEPDLMASTNEPDLMASTNEPDLMASPNEPDLMASTNEPDLMASTNEPDLMASTNEPDLIAEEPNSYQNLSVSDYLLVIERDQTTMQFVAYELDKNAVAHLKLAYSDN